MKIGISIPVRCQLSSSDPYGEFFQLGELADEVGFDFLSIGHHVLTPNYPSAAPLTLLAAMAARTSRIHLASIIFLLSLYHPVVAAEQFATLDLISGGRTIFGVGVGYRPYEFEGYGVDPKRRGSRTDEALTAIRHAWSTGRWGHQGRNFQIPDLPAVPLPVRKPHPPIWVGGVSDTALRRAATLGDGWVTANMHALGEIEAMIADYRGYCAEAGRRPFVCVSRDSWVSHTREDMLRDWYGDTVNRHLDFKRMGFASHDPGRILERLAAKEEVDPGEFIADRAIGGTPEDCIFQIKRLKVRTDCDALLLLTNKNASFEQLSEVIQLFGSEVLPRIR